MQKVKGLSNNIKLKFLLGSNKQPIISYLDVNAIDAELDAVLEDVYDDIIEVGLPIEAQADMDDMMRIYESLNASSKAAVKAKAIEELRKLEE